MAQIIRDNQSNPEEKQYFIPMEVTKETIEDYGLDPKDIVWKLIGNEKKRVYMVPATKEQYQNYMRDQWKAQKRKVRETRCKIPGKNGKLIRCPDSRKCEECERYHNVVKEENKPASLDALAEMGAEPAAEDSGMSDVEVKKTLDWLIDYLNAIKPEYGRIFKLMYDLDTQAEIARELEMAPRTVSDKEAKIREILKPIGNQMYGR